MRAARLLTPLAIAALLAFAYSNAARAHEDKLNCNATASSQPNVEKARNEIKQKPRSAGARVDLSDILVGIGCYDEAVHVLEDGVKLFPADRNLQARLDKARSYISEREFMKKQVTAAANTGDAGFLRLQLRCKQIGDPQACDQAFAMKPDDVSLLVAKGDALLKDKRARDALLAFNRVKQVNTTLPTASQIDVTARIGVAQEMLATQSPPVIAKSAARPPTTILAANSPPRRYSNVEPAGRSN